MDLTRACSRGNDPSKGATPEPIVSSSAANAISSTERLGQGPIRGRGNHVEIAR
jgi:hypothetical protein